jgi:hypothetical protein
MIGLPRAGRSNRHHRHHRHQPKIYRGNMVTHRLGQPSPADASCVTQSAGRARGDALGDGGVALPSNRSSPRKAFMRLGFFALTRSGDGGDANLPPRLEAWS